MTSATDGTDDATSADTGVDDFPQPICGDGELGGDEECDDGNLVNTDECKNDCTFASCGDGVVGPGEACDDGNGSDEDLCTTLCTEAACGDGFLQGGEQCDDANLVDHDGCTASCVDEPFCSVFVGFDCPSGATQFCDTGEIECDDQDDAVAACQACAGEGATCQPFQNAETCSEASGAVDDAGACPGLLNFVYQGDVCNNGIVIDQCGLGQIGTWCTP
jgi:cysteine-rich repeat protein